MLSRRYAACAIDVLALSRPRCSPRSGIDRLLSTLAVFLARRASRQYGPGAEEGVDPVEGAVATPLSK